MMWGVFSRKDLNQKFFSRIFNSLNFSQTLLQVYFSTDYWYTYVQSLGICFVQTPGMYLCTDSRYVFMYRLQVYLFTDSKYIRMYIHMVYLYRLQVYSDFKYAYIQTQYILKYRLQIYLCTDSRYTIMYRLQIYLCKDKL